MLRIKVAGGTGDGDSNFIILETDMDGEKKK